jgi:hypothetical protein
MLASYKNIEVLSEGSTQSFVINEGDEKGLLRTIKIPTLE